MVSNSRKKAPNISILFPLDRRKVSTSRKEGFFENTFSLDVEVPFGAVMPEKNRREWFSLARN